MAALALFAAGAAVLAPTSPALAAREAPDSSELRRGGSPLDLTVVRRVQKALATLGLYSGFIDGKLTSALTAAIRLYQQQAGLAVTGRITDPLVDHLERSLRVSRMLNGLDESRRNAMDAARKALLAHPATRDLIDGDAVAPADAARDASPCFEKPTVRCLLAESFESAKAVTKQDLRDWALGEILAAQARAGLMKQAMETTRRIQDPRLVMVALRDIAQAQARAGREEEALAAAEIIPESRTQIEALAVIADTQARHGYMKAAQDTAALLFSMARHLRHPADQVTFATRAAIALYRAGDEDTADAAMYLARTTAANKVPPPSRVTAWRQVAGALAELDRLDDALLLADEVAQRSDRSAVMIAAAQSAIRAKRLDTAMKLAFDIDAERYRVLVLGEIAVAMARSGDRTGADDVMEEAFIDAEAVALPFARSYAISRLVLALSDMARAGNQPKTALIDGFARARDAAEGIKDPRLRAQVLFEIAAQQGRAGLPEFEIHVSESQAVVAAQAVPSAISRVWVHGDVATLHARAGEQERAWTAFGRALSEARKIDNSWARARAMAKMAQTLIDLVAPTTAAAPDEMSKDAP
jgi:hypothetical protein